MAGSLQVRCQPAATQGLTCQGRVLWCGTILGGLNCRAIEPARFRGPHRIVQQGAAEKENMSTTARKRDKSVQTGCRIRPALRNHVKKEFCRRQDVLIADLRRGQGRHVAACLAQFGDEHFRELAIESGQVVVEDGDIRR